MAMVRGVFLRPVLGHSFLDELHDDVAFHTFVGTSVVGVGEVLLGLSPVAFVGRRSRARLRLLVGLLVLVFDVFFEARDEPVLAP